MKQRNIKLYTSKKNCDFCKHKLTEPYKPINTKRNILTYRCKNCSLLQSIPQKKFSSFPNPSMSFDADRSSIMYTKELVLPYHISFFKKNNVNFSKINSCLDIGSNRGYFSRFILSKNKNIRITAVETRKELIKNYKFNSNVKTYNSRYEIFETNEEFDFIYNVHTLEHLKSCCLAIQKMKKHLSQNGQLFIAVPNINSIHNDFFEEVFIDPHTFHFTNNIMIKIFNKFGLKIIAKNISGDELQYLLSKDLKTVDLNNNRHIEKERLFFYNKKSLYLYKNKITENRHDLKKKAKRIKKLLLNKINVVFWGAGRIFDGLIKIGNIKPSKNIRIVDRNLYKYFKTLHNFRIFKPSDLKRDESRSILVICSRVYKDSILKEAKKYSFNKYIKIF
jgi:2-polyprenyl-3-methyl-5-hydroxy-6-metoxy-1,4-benzoquinol methylase